MTLLTSIRPISSLLIKATVVLTIALRLPDCATLVVHEDVHWSYDSHHGPSHWCKIEPHGQCCGQEQSPIDIDETEVQLEFFKPLVFINYTHTPSQMTIMNNGHTIALTLGDDDSPPGVTGGGLKDYYIFDSLHFHWGKDSKSGSEHTYAGKRYPMEMHLVHYNSKYEYKGKAALNPDGLAVVGVLFQLAEKDNDDMWGIIKALDDVRYNNDSSPIQEPFPLSTLLPPRTDDFFRYQGSLTTPPCSEVVTWSLLDSMVAISEAQLARFRTLRMRTKSDNHREADQLVENYRPTQSLHGRRIHGRSTLAKIRAITAGTSSTAMNPAVLVLSLAAALFVLPGRGNRC